MNLFSWLKSEILTVKIIFSSEDSTLASTFQKLINDVPVNKYSLIIDNKHIWTSQMLNPGSKILLPTSKEHLLKIISSLHEFVHPRLGLIVIDHLPFYYRDFIGKQAKDVALNLRAYSASLAILKKLVAKELLVAIGTYPNYKNQEILVSILS